MKHTNIALLIFFAGIHLLDGKEPRTTAEAFRVYKKNDPESQKSEVDPRVSLSNLLIKENPSVEETLATLGSVRNSPSKDLMPQLKELWKRYHKNTFRTKDPDNWRYIKSIDYNQRLCDEIKILIRGIGGNIDDIEPLDERITFDLNEVRSILISIKNGSRENELDGSELKSLTKKLSEIIKKCKFGVSNEDEKLQTFYILGIIDLLGDERVYSIQKTNDAESSVISFFDEALSKALPLIDKKWVQRPTGSNDQNQDTPNIEQTIQWQKNSLEGYQQLNLRRIRDQILLNVSNMIKMKKADDAFKQEMLKRFSKDNACRKVIEDRLNSSK
jgi:hypothetical protein